MKKVKITIVHPFDPLGSKIGGVQSYIKDFISNAPENFDITLVGFKSLSNVMLRTLSDVNLGNRTIKFFPVIEEKNENKIKKMPLGLKFAYALYRQKREISQIVRDSIIQFHRLEPPLVFLKSSEQKFYFLHRNYFELLNPHCEVRWRYAPFIYKALEKKVLESSNKIFVLSKDGLDFYQRNGFARNSFYVPQWVDTSEFKCTDKDTNDLRSSIAKKYNLNFDNESKIIISWGRLAGQKDPFLMLETFYVLLNKLSIELQKSYHLIIVGDGQLRDKMEKWAQQKNIAANVHFLGRKKQNEIIELAAISDLFLLTSAFETGPISVLEALACGLPVVSTNVGLVKDVVIENKSGIVVDKRSPELIAEKILEILRNKNLYTQKSCRDSVLKFDKKNILQKIYALHEEAGINE